MRRSLILRLLIATAAILGSWASPATAGLTGTGFTDSNESVNARVDSSGEKTGTSAVGQPSEEECTTRQMSINKDGYFRMDKQGNIVSLYDDEHKEDQGAWYKRVCYIRTTQTAYSIFWVVNASATDLARQALASAALPTPTISITPTPPAISYVNMPLWLWIDSAVWQPVTATASADGLTVTVTATPTQVVWDSGDAEAAPNERTKTCGHPGKPYSQNLYPSQQYSDCTYTYFHTSGKQLNLAFPLTATLQWRATWTATNGTSGDLGFVGRSSTIPVKVGEIQALNVRPQGFEQ